ncbi:MAG: hypothetical protein K9N05_07180 [Candidatus Marinimicrobia bacterium]|nr:hypothetical protein [Candidatus Neomarinimicrobiota bacterium]
MNSQKSTTKQTLKKNRKIAETGIFLALFLGLAYAFAYIPNLEYITVIAFLSGLLLGWKRGLFVALIGETIFSIANPFGSSLAFPPTLIAQLLSYAMIALTGSLFRLFIPKLLKTKPILAAFYFGLTGLLLTSIYNIITTLAFTIPSGFTLEQTIASVIGGIPFYLINMIANTVSFSVLITLILRYVSKQYPHYLEKNK